MEAILAVFASTDGDQQKGLHPTPVGQQGLPAPKFGVLQIYTVNTGVVAASAIEGKIADPRDYL